IRSLNEREVESARTASNALLEAASRRRLILFSLLGLSVIAGAALGWVTLRAVERPLERLSRAATKLGEGDLRPVDPGTMATEFAVLADAFTTTRARLFTIVKEVVEESERIASSAGDLSAISQELAASSGEISTSMMEISRGAEEQAKQVAESGSAANQLR